MFNLPLNFKSKTDKTQNDTLLFYNLLSTVNFRKKLNIFFVVSLLYNSIYIYIMKKIL